MTTTSMYNAIFLSVMVLLTTIHIQDIPVSWSPFDFSNILTPPQGRSRRPRHWPSDRHHLLGASLYAIISRECSYHVVCASRLQDTLVLSFYRRVRSRDNYDLRSAILVKRASPWRAHVHALLCTSLFCRYMHTNLMYGSNRFGCLPLIFSLWISRVSNPITGRSRST